MSDQALPYISRNAGDPVTAEDWNGMQVMIKSDIHSQVETAIDALEHVDQAGDAEKFGGKSPDEYAKEIIDRLLHELPKRTGYMALYKDLKVGEEVVLEHKLGAFPLTDIYQLDYFRVVCSEDEHVYESFTTFYLYHSSESKIRFRPETAPTGNPVSIEIDPPDGHPYRIAFKTMLDLYNVKYDDNQSLGDLENDFWKAFFSAPNDEFDDDQYCHSPWFDRCCREERTVRYLKQRGDWDDIWFQVRPRKTINYAPTAKQGQATGTPAPTQIQVAHFDFDTLGLTLLTDPVLPQDWTNPQPSSPDFPAPDPVGGSHLKVLVLLKV